MPALGPVPCWRLAGARAPAAEAPQPGNQHNDASGGRFSLLFLLGDWRCCRLLCAGAPMAAILVSVPGRGGRLRVYPPLPTLGGTLVVKHRSSIPYAKFMPLFCQYNIKDDNRWQCSQIG